MSGHRRLSRPRKPLRSNDLHANRAGEGIRTLDVHLGKVALYH
jgi:hypothetical protein